ncbi:MAG: hypothetical protein ACI81L_002475 [Verrucomicrobiales bacterium]|jgi:hypothetical protein
MKRDASRIIAARSSSLRVRRGFGASRTSIVDYVRAMHEALVTPVVIGARIASKPPL